MVIAIASLLTEHRLIEKVMDALERDIDALEHEGRPISEARLKDYALLLNEFVDHCHHNKEELLFNAMLDHGFSNECGPINLLLAEHDEGRHHIHAIERLGSTINSQDKDAIAQLIQHGRRYVELIRHHIYKEDVIVFPMAIQTLPTDRLNQVGEACIHFDTQDIGSERLTRYREVVQQLANT